MYICMLHTLYTMAQAKFYLEARKVKKTDKTQENQEPEKLRDKNVPILLSYSFHGQRLIYYTGLRVDKKYYVDKYWTGNGRPAIKSTCPDCDYLNNQLNIIVGHLHSAENEAKAAGIPLSVGYFREYLNQKLKEKPTAQEPRKMTFLQYFDQCIEAMKTGTNKKTGHQLSRAMPIKYTTIKNMLEDFEKFRGAPLQWEEFGQQLYDDLVNYMINEKKYALNTYGRATRFIKTILHKATKEGVNTNIKYQSAFTGATEQTDNAYLTEEELDTLYKHDFSASPRHERVRDVFLIGCWTGLRFSDYSSIRPEHVNGDRIKMITKKTGQSVIIPLHPVVKTILEKYNYQLPPAISNQKFNDYLFEVCRDAKLNEPFSKSINKAGKTLVTSGPKHEFITSHSARRTFASNMFKRGVSPYLIMTITGHKTEIEFLKYLKVTAEERAEMFAREAKW